MAHTFEMVFWKVKAEMDASDPFFTVQSIRYWLQHEHKIYAGDTLIRDVLKELLREKHICRFKEGRKVWYAGKGCSDYELFKGIGIKQGLTPA